MNWDLEMPCAPIRRLVVGHGQWTVPFGRDAECSFFCILAKVAHQKQINEVNTAS